MKKFKRQSLLEVNPTHARNRIANRVKRGDVYEITWIDIRLHGEGCPIYEEEIYVLLSDYTPTSEILGFETHAKPWEILSAGGRTAFQCKVTMKRL